MPSAHSEPSGERRRPTGPELARPALGSTRLDQVDDAILRERARTRAWLHDTVLQELEMLAAGAYADEPDPVAMAALAAGAADRLRRVIEGEAPPAAGPLVDEIHALVERERRRSELEVRLRVGKLEPPWAGRDAEPLSDALAEALRNVAKHAGATAVDVSCEIAAGVATVVVTDDGRGFDRHADRSPRRPASLHHRTPGTRGWTCDRRLRSGPRHTTGPAARAGAAAVADRGGRLMDVRVMLAEDFPLVSEGVAAALERDPGITVVGTAVDGAEALRMALELRPDVLLIDLHMPELGGIMVLERLRTAAAGHPLHRLHGV